VVFHFRGISVEHRASAQKIGTDATLLAGYLRVHGGEWGLSGETRGADLGAGCGVIGLLLAQRWPYLRVDLVEKDALSAEECRFNAANTQLDERATAVHAALPQWTPNGPLDWAVSNPPYFKGLPAGNERRDAARHQAHLPPEVLASWFRRWVKPNGWLALVVPEPSDYSPALGSPVRWVAFRTVHGEEPKRHLLFWVNRTNGTLDSDPLTEPEHILSLYDENGVASESYRHYCGDLLLRFPERTAPSNPKTSGV
jgi:hypothetical protein